MKSLEEKLKRAIETNKLNPDRYLGYGKYWYQYFLVATELVWARNLCDGYNLCFYDNDGKYERQTHIATFKLDYVLGDHYYMQPRIQTIFIDENYL
jgi:hypothetical protein